MRKLQRGWPKALVRSVLSKPELRGRSGIVEDVPRQALGLRALPRACGTLTHDSEPGYAYYPQATEIGTRR